MFVNTVEAVVVEVVVEIVVDADLDEADVVPLVMKLLVISTHATMWF